MERHANLVANVAANVRRLHQLGQPFRVNHGNSNCTREPPRKQLTTFVDIGALCNVVSVDTSARTALVEANVPMDRLVEVTLRHGLIPPVIMEFPGITAGGGFSGTAGESSSYRYGFFDETVNSIEMVLGNGDIVRASPDKRADLFHAAAGALGTLGIVTMLELRLVPARRWVRLTYHATASTEESLAKIRAETAVEANDFVDGIQFSHTHGVVVSGFMTDDKPAAVPVQTFSRAWDLWFYLHARDKTANGAGPSTEYVPLAEYLFRWDRGAFWTGAAMFSILWIPFNRFTRWLLDDLLHTRTLYRARQAGGNASACLVIQDLTLPYDTAKELIEYQDRQLGIWPLWLAPVKNAPATTFHPSTTRAGGPSPDASPDQVINIGLWGWGPLDYDAYVMAKRALETKIAELGGRKWLYAQTFFTEDEFWRIYGSFHDIYMTLRQKYHATSLPTMYDKVRQPVRLQPGWGPVGALINSRFVMGVWGAWKAITSGDIRLHRNPAWAGDGLARKGKVHQA